jgi:chromosome segregation ATPase
MQLDQAMGDLKKAKEAIDQNQQDNSKLRMEKHSLQDRVSKLSQTLEDTTQRLSSEVDVASEMKSQLAELKLEYIAAGDKLEAEQNVIRELQVDLRNMESALNAVSHDKKAAQMENVQLCSQLEAAQKAVLAAQAAQSRAEEQLSSSQAMIEGLQERVEDVTASLEVSSSAAQSTAEVSPFAYSLAS